MNKNRLLFIGIGVALGAIGGYAYYAFIGCASGTCAITSNPINSTLYGMVMGGLALDMVRDLGKKKTTGEE